MEMRAGARTQDGQQLACDVTIPLFATGQDGAVFFVHTFSKLIHNCALFSYYLMYIIVQVSE